MIQLRVACEGQTEEDVVKRLLVPALAGVQVRPVVLNGGRGLAPEDVNDGAQTAPSKRIGKAFPGYIKRVHGPAALEQIGLEALRRACPRFDAWIKRLQGLASAAEDRPQA